MKFQPCAQKYIYSVVAINVTTSEIIYDQYNRNDDHSSSIETVLRTYRPCELVLPKKEMSEDVELLMSKYIGNSIQSVLVERFEKHHASPNIAEHSLRKGCGNVELRYDALLGCIGLAHSYLVQFKLDSLLKSFENFKNFRSSSGNMFLNGITARNLELFENNLRGGVHGSLFWCLDHNCTPFGRRLLKRWLQSPLCDSKNISERLDAVAQLNVNWDTSLVQDIRKQLAGCFDLENLLTVICLGKATPEKFLKFVDCLDKLRDLFLRHSKESENKFNVFLLRNIYNNIPKRLGCKLQDALRILNRDSAMKGENKKLFYTSQEVYPEVYRIEKDIEQIESRLESHRKHELTKALRKQDVEYKCVSGLEYLIEVRSSEVKLVPSDWIKVSATKKLLRFRSPVVDECFQEICRKREELNIATNEAWSHFLSEFSLLHDTFRKTITDISTFDCLMSLSIVSRQPGYSRPRFENEDDGCLEIIEGRHPVGEALLREEKQYVANDISLSCDHKVMLISGPNMGGKSSFMKQVAVNCILAQVGSYVAATNMKLSPLDGIYTRMGACDNMAANKSTFMVEMEEAANIVRKATSKSLVILDELGRGKFFCFYIFSKRNKYL